MGEIRPKKCEPRELTKDQLARSRSSSAAGKQKVVMLSGFSDKPELKELETQLQEMGARVKRGNAFDKTITHVVAPVK